MRINITDFFNDFNESSYYRKYSIKIWYTFFKHFSTQLLLFSKQFDLFITQLLLFYTQLLLFFTQPIPIQVFFLDCSHERYKNDYYCINLVNNRKRRVVLPGYIPLSSQELIFVVTSSISFSTFFICCIRSSIFRSSQRATFTFLLFY